MVHGQCEHKHWIQRDSTAFITREARGNYVTVAGENCSICMIRARPDCIVQQNFLWKIQKNNLPPISLHEFLLQHFIWRTQLWKQKCLVLPKLYYPGPAGIKTGAGNIESVCNLKCFDLHHFKCDGLLMQLLLIYEFNVGIFKFWKTSMVRAGEALCRKNYVDSSVVGIGKTRKRNVQRNLPLSMICGSAAVLWGRLASDVLVAGRFGKSDSSFLWPI